MLKKPCRLAALLGLVLLAQPAWGQTESKVQSKARPFGLDVASPVYVGATDQRSKEFKSEALPQYQRFVKENLSETKRVNAVAGMRLDPKDLKLATDSDVRFYFVGEGAGYHNTLGVNSTGVGIGQGDPKMIFPDASMKDSWYLDEKGGKDPRSKSEPLMPGDFASAKYKAGTQLDFFVIANGANSPDKTQVWTAHDNMNSDRKQHMVAFAAKGSSYLLIGFEDLRGGGDNDFNDVVFAVDIGKENVSKLLGAPEPATLTLLAACGALPFFCKRFRRRGGEAAGHMDGGNAT